MSPGLVGFLYEFDTWRPPARPGKGQESGLAKPRGRNQREFAGFGEKEQERRIWRETGGEEDLERRAGLPDLSMAADHNAAGRERPMLGPDVGDLTHLEPNLNHVFTSRYSLLDKVFASRYSL